MASPTQVKTYLAHWFQLGKKLVWQNGQEKLLPQSIIQGESYAPEFEACWQKVMSVEGENCYLEGSTETIAELLSASWDIDNCVRCSMPVPILEATATAQSLDCVCSDLDNWPNFELPAPRSPINSSDRLNSIRNRLNSK